MKATICDICKETITFDVFAFKKWIVKETLFGFTNFKLDVCDKCFDKILTTIKVMKYETTKNKESI